MEEQWKHITGQSGLQAFTRSFWFADKSRSSFWIRIYTSLGIKHADFANRMRELFDKVDWGKNILVALGQMEGFKAPVSDSIVCANEEGMTNVIYMLRELALPKANYIWISTPYCIDGKKIEISDVISALDRISALLCVHLGRNVLHEMVFNGEVKADTGEYSTGSPVQRTPTASDGPFFDKQLTTDMGQVMQRLRIVPQEVRTRVELALRYFENA